MTRPPKAEQVLAGVSSLARFGWIGPIDNLAGGDPLKWIAAMNLSYDYAITKLELENERQAFSERYSKVLEEIAKNNSPKSK